jgi:phosphate uptake regulator
MNERTEYLKDYQNKRKEHVRRVNLSFSVAEYSALEKTARLKGQKPTTFIKDLAMQAYEDRVVLPLAVEEELFEQTRLIRTMANNLNQMARHSHQIGQVLDENEPLLEIMKLEQQLRATIEKLSRNEP